MLTELQNRDVKDIFAELNLELIAEKWDGLYPRISKPLRAVGADDPAVCLSRRYSPGEIYTTNVIKSLNITLRNVTTNRRISPSYEAV